MKKTVIDHAVIFLFRKIKNTKIMALNMRQPNHLILGYIAKRVMLFGNQKVIEDSVVKLNVLENDAVIEVGSGNGQALTQIKKYKPAKIFAIEISARFRSDLQSKFKNENIIILKNDAKDLGDVIQTASIDKILLINVIYFLNPLEDYLIELKRVLKNNGVILIAGRFSAVGNFEKSVFINTDLESLLLSFNNHFEVSTEYVDLGEEQSQYHAISLTKTP